MSLFTSFLFILQEIRKAGGRRLYLLAGLTLVISLLPFGGYFFLKELLDVLMSGNGSAQVFPGGALLALGLTWLLIPLLQNQVQYRQETLDLLVQSHFGQLIMGKSSRVALAYYENPDFFDSLHRAQEEVTYRPAMILQAVLGLSQGLTGTLIALTVLLLQAWWLAVIFIFSLAPVIFIRIYYSRKLYQEQLATTSLRRQTWYLHNILTGKTWAKELRLFQFAPAWINKYQKTHATLFQRQSQVLQGKSRGSSLTQILEIAVLMVALVFFVRQTWQGLLSIPVFVMLVQVLQRGQSALQTIMQSLVHLYHHQLFARHIFTFLHLPDETENKTYPAVFQPSQTIRLNDVSFTYPGNQQPALKQINLSWQRGKVLALVGQNGSGKSTIVNVLSGFYPEYRGQILADKIELRSIDPDSWRKNLAVVQQDYGQYQLTAEENITLGNDDPGADENKLASAIKITQVNEFIQDWPAGITTQLGKQYGEGEELSGGQWQRLAISRALYKEADMLILDEPTSAIDPVVEYQLLRQIKELYAEKFLLLITHRVYNLRLADQIIVLDHGRVVESGSFDALIEQRGAFFNLFQNQL